MLMSNWFGECAWRHGDGPPGVWRIRLHGSAADLYDEPAPIRQMFLDEQHHRQ